MKNGLGLAALVLPSRVFACAICFGAVDGKSGLFNGFWWGIVILLAVTMSLVAAIAWTLWTVERRRAHLDA